MTFNKFKFSLIIISFILTIGLIGCSITEQSKPNNSINISKLLQYKDCNIGDNSSISAILSNLPANKYVKDFELQTDHTPYGLTVNYKDFDSSSIEFDDKSILSLPFEDVLIKDAMIIISLVKNADVINFKFDKGITITYKKVELIDAYKKDFGNNLDEITKNEKALESFIKSTLK